MVREFKIVNEKGQEFSLMNIKKYCLLTDPTGLGYSYNTDYEQLGNTFITNLRKLEQGIIRGTLNFINYDNYTNFINFVEKSEKLKFIYKIPYKDNYKEFIKDIQINSLSKSQKNTSGFLSESVEFDCLSLWYEENTTVYKIEPKENEIRWDFMWDSKFSDYNTRNLQYINNGHIEAPISVEVDGHIINPQISLFIDGEEYQTIKVKTEIAEYEKFLYSSKENEFFIKKQKTNGLFESLFNLDFIDFYNDNVLRIPKNRSCELKLLADNEILNAKITIFPQYKAI